MLPLRSCMHACMQAAAELPFDGTGLDDVFLELAREFSEVLDLGPGMQMFNDTGSCFGASSSAKGKGKGK